MTETAPVICLDGPSGVGKGTICLAVAKQLGWHILDSGSLYRITALQVCRDFPEQAINSLDELQLTDIAKNLSVSYAEKNNELIICLGDTSMRSIRSGVSLNSFAPCLTAILSLVKRSFSSRRASADAMV